MRSTSATIVAMLLAAALAAPATVLAQSQGTSRGPAHPPMARSMTDRVDQRIADLHAKLHITADQQPKWDRFAQVMRDNAQHMTQVADERAGKIKAMNASENMQSYAQIAMRHAQDLQNLAAEFQPLYEALSQDQQHIADAMFRDVGMHHGAKHGR